MRTHFDLFCVPCDIAGGYLEGVKDVRREMEKLVNKKAKNDYERGWNACIIALSKNIKIEKGKFPK